MNTTAQCHAERNLAALQISKWTDICAEYTLRILPFLDPPNAFTMQDNLVSVSSCVETNVVQEGQTRLCDFGVAAVVTRSREASWNKLCAIDADFWTRFSAQLQTVPGWSRATPPQLKKKMRARNRRDPLNLRQPRSRPETAACDADPDQGGKSPSISGDDGEDGRYQVPWNMDGFSKCRPSGYTYRRMNHFNAVLGTYQCKRKISKIPPDILALISTRVRLLRSEPVPSAILSILKELRLPKLYQHSVALAIHFRACSEAPPITKAMEIDLKERFKQVEAAYDSAKIQTRRNFLSYRFVLRKLLELENSDEANSVISMLPLTKNKAKVRAQDAIWEQLCGRLGWNFISTSV
jgi:hypothetical protein